MDRGLLLELVQRAAYRSRSLFQAKKRCSQRPLGSDFLTRSFATPPRLGAINTFCRSMHARLLAVEAIACWKALNHYPLCDPKREGHILASAGLLAPALQASGRALLAGLIASSKELQERVIAGQTLPRHDEFQSDGYGLGGFDLSTARAQIDRVDSALLTSLAELRSRPLTSCERKILSHELAIFCRQWAIDTRHHDTFLRCLSEDC